MGCLRPLRIAEPSVDHPELEHYWREGYAIVRGLFSAEEIAEIAAAADQVHAEGVRHGRCFRHGNLFYNVAAGDDGDPLVRMVQWPSYHQPVLDRVRLDTRIARLLEPLIGRDLKQIINQVHWKAPGSLGDFAWHQDSRSRRPASAYRNLGDFLRADRARHRPAHAGIGLHALHSRAAICAATSAWTARRGLGTAMSDDGARGGRPVGVGRGRPGARTRRPGAVEPISGARLGHQPVGPPAPPLHQRICASG